MAYGTSWRSKGNDLDPRDVVEEAARAAGLSVEEWLETAADSAFDGGKHSRVRRRNRSVEDDNDSPLTRLARRIERREGRMRDDAGHSHSEERVARIVSDAMESFQDSLRANEERTASVLAAISRTTNTAPDHGPNRVRTLISDIERKMDSHDAGARSGTQSSSPQNYSDLTRQIENRIENVLNSIEQKTQHQLQPLPIQAAPVVERPNRDLRSAAAINAALAKVNSALRGLDQSPQQAEILKTLRSLDQRLSGLEQSPQNNPEVVGQMVGEMAALQQHMAKQRPGADMSSVNKHMLSLGDRIDVLTRSVGSQPAQSNQLAKQFTSQFANQFEKLTAEISELRSSLRESPSTPDVGIETLRHQMASMGDNLNHLTQKIAALRNNASDGHSASKFIDGDINELKRLIQVSQTPVHDERVFNALQALENKIAAVERTPNDLSVRLDRIQAMMGEQKLATIPPHVEDLLQGLVGRLKDFETTSQDDFAFARLHEEIQQISRKLEQSPSISTPQAFADVSGLERSVSAILQHVDGLKSDMGSLAESAARRATQEALSHLTPAVQSNATDLSGVEQSIKNLFHQIDGWKADISQVAEQAAQRATQELMLRMPAQAVHAQPDLSSIEHSIQGLFSQMDAWKADIGMVAEDAARRATSEAMRQAPAFASQGGGAETVELQRALGDMQSSQKDAERRTTQTLEAVHDTLKRVVDRLVDMEKDIEAKSVIAAPPVQHVAVEQFAMDTGRKPLNIQTATPVTDQLVEATPPVAAASPSSAGWNVGQLTDGAASAVAAMRAQRMGVSSPTVTTSPPSKGPLSAALSAARNAVSGIKLPSRNKSEPTQTVDAAPITQAVAPHHDFDAPLEPGSGRPQKTDAAHDPKAKFLAAARHAAQVAAGHAADTLAQHGPDIQSKMGKKPALKTKHALLLGLAALVVAVGATLSYTGLPKILGGGTKPKEIVGTIDHVRKQVQISHQHRQQTMQTADATRIPPRQIVAEIQDDQLPEPLVKESRSLTVAGVETKRPVVPSGTGASPSSANLSDPVTVGSIVPNVQSTIRNVSPSQKPTLSVSNDPLFQFVGLKEAAGLKSAARNGEVAAFIELGSRFSEGRGAERNPKTAALWFERAAEQGSATARYRLGAMYREGKGVDRNPKMALAHFIGAAELGNARAMHNTAVLLAEGVNGSPDYAGAAEWFKRAAEYGIRDSQFNLAILYARGLGTSQDLVTSYSWFSAAATQGDEDSNKKRDEVGSRLTPAQLKQAKEAAATWRAKTPDVAANEVLPAPSSWDAPSKASSPAGNSKQSRS